MRKTIHIVLVDDHDMVRRGIKTLLDQAEGFEVVGEASDGQEAFELVAALQPDVIVMDISMPAVNGLEATAMIRDAGIPSRILILSNHGSANLAGRAMKLGASGYVLKRGLVEELPRAVRTVAAGETYLSPLLQS